MRAALGDLARAGASGLDARVVAALGRGRAAASPAERETAGPAAIGEIGSSDAG